MGNVGDMVTQSFQIGYQVDIDAADGGGTYTGVHTINVAVNQNLAVIVDLILW